MSDENLEAPNPFNQHQLESGDSLKFEGGFWDEPAVQRNGSAYDDDDSNNNTYGSNNNAYDQDNDKQNKPNAITNLFNNMKDKLKNDNNDNNNNNNNNNDNIQNNGAYDNAYDNSWIDEPTKPSKSEGKSSNLLTTNQITMTHEQLNKKEAYLDKREKQLLERKKRLAAVKHELNSTNIRRDNWPCSYYPITFHSIQQEIPPHARSHMKRMYTLVLMTFFCFILNAFAQLILYFVSDPNSKTLGSDSDILLAILYLFCGVCGAWRLWYRQIYYGIRDRKTLKWWCFFIFFFAHIGFCIIMVIGIEGWGGAGIITMIDAFNEKKSFAGFFCLICSCLWSINALGSCFYFKRSWILFKQRGGIQASQGAIANVVAQHAAEQLV